ncbi:MAG: sulfurtransferase TusA family protein [Thermodesulfovibrionia bacterium]|jgi:TusA-related sulfurtransferase|nr:sulfurtransferase TusA family protein [Thermodesulfovibrionia bacterium]
MQDIKVDKKLDIRGEVCPYTLVKSKLGIESIELGQTMEIILDYPEAADSIPKAMLNYGHSVLKTEKINSKEWVILVRKEVED